MFILFFLVHLFFAWAFFSLEAYTEAGGFVLLWLVSAFLFGPFRFWQGEKTEEQADAISQLDGVRSKIKARTIAFFKNWVLPLSVAFLYLALFWIVWSLSDIHWITLSQFANMLSILIAIASMAVLFSPLRAKSLVLDLARANILVLCVIQMAMLSTWLLREDSVSLFAFFSQLLLIGALASTFLEEYRRGEPLSRPFLLQLFVFSYLFSTASILTLTGFESQLWVHAMVALLLWSGWFEIVSLRMFRECRVFVRLFSVIFVYVGTLGLLALYLASWIGHGVLLLLLFAFFFNAYVHRRFENYVSLLFCLFIVIAVFERVIGISDGFLVTLLSGWLLSFWLAFIGKVLKSPHSYDQYFFQSSALVSALGHFIWFMAAYGMLGMLEFSILLLFFSALLFVSYLRIVNK